jgi:hypothetical protein
MIVGIPVELRHFTVTDVKGHTDTLLFLMTSGPVMGTIDSAHQNRSLAGDGACAGIGAGAGVPAQRTVEGGEVDI